MNRHFAIAASMIFAFSSFAPAAFTPMTEELKDDSTVSITAEYDGNTVMLSKTVGIKSDKGEYHYDLYVPPGYNADPKETFPVLFIMAPGGTAKIAHMKNHAKSARYLVVMLQEAKNGPWEPIVANFISAHDDVIKRARVAEGFKYMTGFSGGARASTMCCELRPGFAGIFLQGAGLWPQYAAVPHNINIAVFAAMGDKDNNTKETTELMKAMPPGKAFRLAFFEGEHHPAPDDMIEQAFDFLETWTYDGMPPFPAGMPMYRRHYVALKTAADAETGEYAKYVALEHLDKFATTHLAKEKDLADELKSLHKTVTDQVKSAAAKKEAPARDAYQKAVDLEVQARAAAKGDVVVHKVYMGKTAKSYQAVVEKFPDSYWSAKAKTAVERLTKEAGEAPPAAPAGK